MQRPAPAGTRSRAGPYSAGREPRSSSRAPDTGSIRRRRRRPSACPSTLSRAGCERSAFARPARRPGSESSRSGRWSRPPAQFRWPPPRWRVSTRHPARPSSGKSLRSGPPVRSQKPPRPVPASARPERKQPPPRGARLHHSPWLRSAALSIHPRGPLPDRLERAGGKITRICVPMKRSSILGLRPGAITLPSLSRPSHETGQTPRAGQASFSGISA